MTYDNKRAYWLHRFLQYKDGETLKYEDEFTQQLYIILEYTQHKVFLKRMVSH